MRSRPILGCVFAGALLFAAEARAQSAEPTRPIARLLYRRGVNAQRCPEEGALRALVASRLGYDPFSPAEPRLVLLLLERGSGGYRAQLELRDAGDRLLGERSLSSASSDCSALADSVALALALAAETFARAEARAAAPRPPPSPLTLHGVALAHPPQAPVPPPSSAAPRELEAQVGMGMLAGLGWHPSVNGGALLRAGVRWRLLSVNLEGRADLPVSTAVDNGTSARVATGFYGGSLSACLHWRFLGGCLAGHLAAFSAEGMNVDRPQQGTTVFAAVGARLLGTFDVAGPFSVQLALDLAAPVARPALWFDGRLSWQPPWVVGALGALAVLRFR